MVNKLIVPEHLHRNGPNTIRDGYEYTGKLLIDLACKALNIENLSKSDVLDIGCGVRFTMTILNEELPLKTYTGIDIDSSIIDFLKKNVEKIDSRFKFYHWNAHNYIYNQTGVQITKQLGIPTKDTFDIIWLFSVFTHQNPNDVLIMLKLLRERIRINGKLFFTAFIDNDITGFEDRIKDQPLLQAYYNFEFLKELIEKSGWRAMSFNEKGENIYIEHYIICVPV